MWTFGVYGGVNLTRYIGSSLLWSGWVVSFCGPGPNAGLYLLLGFLSVPSFSTSALVTLDFLSLTVQSRHRFLRPFSLSGIECDIGVRSLVIGSLWF